MACSAMRASDACWRRDDDNTIGGVDKVTVQELIDKLTKLVANDPSMKNRYVAYPYGNKEHNRVVTVFSNVDDHSVYLF